MTFKNLIEKISVACQHAIRGKVRSDVFCNAISKFIAEYRRALELKTDRSVFAGSRPEDFGKLARAEDGLTPAQAKRLAEADDEGANLLDDGDAFD